MPGFSQHSYTFDLQTRLRDSALAARTVTAAEADVLDFGNVTSGPAVEQVAYTNGYLVIDVASIDRTTGDEAYDIVLQLSDDASGNGVGFDAGDVVVAKLAVHLGEELGPDADPDAAASGRIVVKVDNERLGTIFRFMRLATVVAGTTPIISYGAFYSPLD